MPSKMMIAAAGGAVVVGAGLWFYKQQQEKERLAKAQQAFCFIKPHAVTPKVIALSKDMLTKAGITITGEGELTAETIDSKRLIDTHYGAIAKRAVVQKPSELTVPKKAQDAFKKTFGLDWASAVAGGQVYNATEACAKLGLDGAGLDAEWSKLKRNVDLLKFGGGFYCGKVKGIYVMNGFYMAMRGAYTEPGKKIYWFTLDFPEDKLSWADFRGKVLGATNPEEAEAGSVRRQILEDWQGLGLAARPDTGDNGVHASASPFEGLAERLNWLGATVEGDAYGAALLEAGVPKPTVVEWTTDPVVAGGSLFDALEDLDRTECLRKAVTLVGK